MGDDLVSIIIPTYKRADYLNRAIESVLNQTYSSIEIIVVDDNDSNSPYRKNTETIMKEYETFNNVNYIKHERNLNGSAARNTGIRVAKGNLIAFLDDDDEFINTKIENQVLLMKKLNIEYGAVYGGYNILRGSKVTTSHIPNKNGRLTSELLQMNWGTGSGSNVLFRKEVFDKIGFFDESLKRHQDWDVLLRMFRYFSIYAMEDILVNIYKDSRINIPNPDDFVVVKDQFLSKFEDDINKLSLDESNNIYKMHLLEITTAYLKTKRYNQAQKYYKKAKKYAVINRKQKLALILTIIFFNLPKREEILIYFGGVIEKIRMIKN